MSGDFQARIENLPEFQAAMSAVARLVQPATDRGAKRGMQGVMTLAQQLAPKRTGELAGSGRLQLQAAQADLVFGAEHAPILEAYQRGRFAGLTGRYGPPPRFAGRALQRKEDDVVRDIDQELAPVLQAQGWLS